MLALLLAFSCSDPIGKIANLDSQGSVVVCFGDSVTAGYGVNRDQAFPALVAEKLEIPVLNVGVDGDTTADALARLDRDVLAHDPFLVVVEFGGNDFRKRVDRQETFDNIDRIVGRIVDHGAMVAVLELQIGIFRDKYLAGYKEVCKRHGALLIPDFMDDILGNHDLTVDGIHPSPQGHVLIADRVAESLAPLLGQARRSPAGKRQVP